MSNQYRDPADARPSLRIDKLFYYLRFARNRVMAKKLAEKGHVRLNGRRVDRGHIAVHADDILTLPLGRDVAVIRVIALPERRASAAVASGCFERLETSG